MSTHYIQNCSNYYLIVFTWKLAPVHLAVGLENTRLTIVYTAITILLIYHKTRGYLYFNESYKFLCDESYKFLCDNVHNYNRIQQFVSNYCLDASIYHLRQFGNRL